MVRFWERKKADPAEVFTMLEQTMLAKVNTLWVLMEDICTTLESLPPEVFDRVTWWYVDEALTQICARRGPVAPETTQIPVLADRDRQDPASPMEGRSAAQEATI